MLPEDLRGSYAQYKNDTMFIVLWLERQSQRCGYKLEEDTSDNVSTSAAKPIKPGGRERKLAEQAEQQTSSKKFMHPRTCNHVPVKHILPMAKTIISPGKPAIMIPKSIFRTLDRAINLRLHVSDTYQQPDQNCSFQDLESDSGHIHFVEVLKKVRELFQGREISPTTTCRNVTPASTSTKQKDLSTTNGFSSLHIYETLDTEIDFGDIDSELVNAGEQDEHGDVYILEQIPDSQEALIALQCLLEDLAATRQVIQRLWEDYKDGNCDLVTASLTTNTAIELARRLEDALKILETYGASTKLPHKMADLCRAIHTIVFRL